jgi:hypothetical protein
MALIDKLKAIANGFRASRGTEQEYSLDEMAVLAAEKVGGGSGGSGDGTPKAVKSLVNITASTRILFPSGVEYYYNHEQLPEIPVYVVENYPYILIMRTLTTTRIYASVEKPYHWTPDNGTARITIPTGAYIRAKLNIDANSWIIDSSGTSTWLNTDGTSAGWSVWWSSYDIPNGSADAEEIYFPASLPQEEQPADATHFYYSGERLPKIPEDVLAEYPYVYMIETNAFSAFSVKPYFYSTTDYPSTLKADGGGVRYTYDAETDSWVFGKEYSSVYIILSGFHWTNYDVPNGSADATDVYHYGTLAVPDPD